MRQVDLDFDALYPVFPYLPCVNKYRKSKKAIPKLIRFSTLENRLLLNQWSSQTAYHCVDSALQLKRGFFCFMLLLFPHAGSSSRFRGIIMSEEGQEQYPAVLSVGVQNNSK